MAVAFVLHGDPPGDAGPPSWPIGVLLVVALGAICTAAAMAGRASRPEPEDDAPDPSADAVS
jgi:hypothetical protein